MAQELLFEDEAPFASTAQRPPLDTYKRPHPHLCDERWAEVALARLRDIDEWAERKKRLVKGRPGPKPPVAELEAEVAAQQRRPRNPRPKPAV